MEVLINRSWKSHTTEHLQVTQTGDLISSMDAGHKKPYEILLMGRFSPSSVMVDERVKELPERNVLISVPCSLHSKKPPLAGSECVYVCVDLGMRAYVHAYVYVCVFCVWIYMCVCVCGRVYMHTVNCACVCYTVVTVYSSLTASVSWNVSRFIFSITKRL